LIAKTPEEAFETSLPFGKARLDFTVSPNAALRTALAGGGESQQPGAEALDAREEKVRIAADVAHGI
jgi:hypothetical protein